MLKINRGQAGAIYALAMNSPVGSTIQAEQYLDDIQVTVDYGDERIKPTRWTLPLAGGRDLLAGTPPALSQDGTDDAEALSKAVSVPETVSGDRGKG